MSWITLAFIFGSVFLYSWFLMYSFNANDLSKKNNNKKTQEDKEKIANKYNETIQMREELVKMLRYYKETENYEMCTDVQSKISACDILLEKYRRELF